LERVHVVIDEKAIATMDAFAIIEPVWWTGNVSGSYEDYESSLARFSRGQRILYAIHWYQAEVFNGGHQRFYSNPTGIVWADVQKGFSEIGISEGEKIVEESARRIGGHPPFEWDERNHIMDQWQPNFDDLDDRFYKLAKVVNIDEKMLAYIRRHTKDFVFAGEIERPVVRKWPGLPN
jgi:hypothetical protein